MVQGLRFGVWGLQTLDAKDLGTWDFGFKSSQLLAVDFDLGAALGMLI